MIFKIRCHGNAKRGQTGPVFDFLRPIAKTTLRTLFYLKHFCCRIKIHILQSEKEVVGRVQSYLNLSVKVEVFKKLFACLGFGHCESIYQQHQHPPGVSRAFDSLARPERQEFDFSGCIRAGILTPFRRGGGYLNKFFGV